MEERKKRQRLKKSLYKPNSGQLPVHKSKKKMRLCVGGNGLGKTAMAVNEAFWRAHGYNPITQEYFKVPSEVAVVLDKPEKSDRVWLPEAKKWFHIEAKQLHKRGRANTTEISFPNGSRITFYSHDQDPLTFESIEIDMAIFDEPPPRHIYIGLRRGGRKIGSKARYLIVGTPISSSWLRREILTPWAKHELSDTDCFEVESDVNKANVDWEAQLDFFSKLKEKELATRRHGKFFDLQGLALDHLFQRETHVVDPWPWAEGWPCVMAIDPHPSKDHVAVLMGCSPDGELFILEELSSNKVAKELAKDIRVLLKKYRIVDIVVDCLGSANYTGGDEKLSFIKVLQNERIPVRATSYNEKLDEIFIDKIRNVLAIPTDPDNYGRCTPELRIFSHCTGCINDIENVEWTKQRITDENKTKLEISNRDYLACIKYCLATNPNFGKGKQRVYRRKKSVTTYGQRKRAS
ncbi:MAG: terminase large subunit domain-containing protein [Candidatus Baldrarchaeia archaeon]